MCASVSSARAHIVCRSRLALAVLNASPVGFKVCGGRSKKTTTATTKKKSHAHYSAEHECQWIEGRREETSKSGGDGIQWFECSLERKNGARERKEGKKTERERGGKGRDEREKLDVSLLEGFIHSTEH